MDRWVEIFVNTRADVLRYALQDVTTNADRMPTPGMLTKAIALAKEKLGVRGTPSLVYTTGQDARGVRCVFWSDQPQTPAYRATDCPEGRAFLAEMAKVSGKTPDECARLMEGWANAR